MNSLLAASMVTAFVSSSATPLPSVFEAIATSEARLNGTTQQEEATAEAAPGSLSATEQEAAPAPQNTATKLADPGEGASGMVALDDAMAGASGLQGASTMAVTDDLTGAGMLQGASTMMERTMPGSQAGAMPMGGWYSTGARGMSYGFGRW